MQEANYVKYFESSEEDYGEDKACKFNRSQVAAWRSDRTRPRWGTTGTPDPGH